MDIKNWFSKKLFFQYFESNLRKVLFGAGVAIGTQMPSLQPALEVFMEAINTNWSVISQEFWAMLLIGFSSVWGMKDKLKREKIAVVNKLAVTELLEKEVPWVHKVKLKEGISLHKLKPEIRQCLEVALEEHERLGYPLTVTSTFDDAKGRKPNSKHKTDDAFDSRIRGIPKSAQVEIRENCKRRLGRDYDIVIEGHHIHWEYDPKSRETVAA